MDDHNSPPKIRRPLPTPGGVTQRPNTPVLSSPILAPPSTFYGQPTPPHLPVRPKNVGSNFTSYVAPYNPEEYGAVTLDSTSDFREPELVEEGNMADDDEPIPALVPQFDVRHWSNTAVTDWETNPPDTSWDEQFATSTDWGMINAGLAGSIEFTSKQNDIAIDGRLLREELNWWDPRVREKIQRPGPGMLPPVLAGELHDPEHTLFSVNVTSPPFPVSTSPQNPSGSPPISTSFSQQALNAPPTEEEVRTSVPHPNAYYCPKENGWVILSWKSSTVAPPLAKSFENAPHLPLPDQERRKRTALCIGEGEQPFGQSNKTHHFHKYAKAVDSHKLTPPLRIEDWEANGLRKQRRRGKTVVLDDFDFDNLDVKESELAEFEKNDDEEEGKLLDLYVCCQCSLYCVASSLIPGIVPRKRLDEFAKEKRLNPPPGKNGEQSVLLGLETILLAMENKLWKGESRMIKVARPNFQQKVGWNANIKQIFELMGFSEEVSAENELTIQPPYTDTSTPEGRINKRKLLRAWVELSSWLADFYRLNATSLKDYKYHKLYVQLDNAREMYQNAIGAHPKQIPRGELSDTLMDALQPYEKEWLSLGLTMTSYNAELLAFAYLAQCRCDPANTMEYFTHFSTLVTSMQNYASCPARLEELLAVERSRDRFIAPDVENAAIILGFGADGVLQVDYDSTVDDNFIESAWKSTVQRSWRDHDHGAELHREANDALRILAESKGSIQLRKLWEDGRNKYMNPERAYDTLEIPKEVDDFMLITVFNMRIEEQASQIDKWKEALSVIAEVRDSERLRQFLATGLDPGDIVTPTSPNLPRGLNQLGNTCYLNSLLQYFYTIKDLREAVMPMSKLDLTALDDEKFSDDELKRHRVGGRLVTRREIVRSKKFIHQLAELFFNLEYCETASVTPTIELAKLALVTSRDEEEEEADKGGTDSSNDTDATLVDDLSKPPALELAHSSSSSPSSVLGKRTREVDRQSSMMDVDTPYPESPREMFVAGSSRSSHSPQPVDKQSSSLLPEASSSKLVDNDGDGDVVMKSGPPKAPPLPPRKRTEPNDSVMMFGKQHDVAECMDNCMFQIETALLKFNGLDEMQSESSDKTSIVKRLFYGKIRQRLTAIPDTQLAQSSIHEKEDLFSHLPVNVTDDGIDIYDGLSGYFDDIVEFEGRKARMEVSLVDLPPVLQIQLQRVQFNRDTLQPYKSQAYVKFGETIYMDRFMDNADAPKKTRSKAIQSELSSARERIRLLVDGKDSPYTLSIEQTSNFLTQLQENSMPEIDQDLILNLYSEKDRIQQEIDDLRSRADHLKDELETLWRDSVDVAYDLTSVFIHRGSSPSWGHYFFYSRNLPDSPDSWFKYNDSDVTVVSKDEVLADTTGSTANPYLLVFARKGSDVVDTVKRFDSSLMQEPE